MTYGCRTAIAILVGASSLFVAVGDAQPTPELDAALQALDADHDRALAAVHVLQQGSAEAAVAIRDGWTSLSRPAQRRALLALAALAPDHEPAVDALVIASHSADVQMSQDALRALGNAGPLGWRGLADSIGDPDVGDRAAIVLARADPSTAWPVFLEALAVDGGSNRAALRQALAASGPQASGILESKVRAWLETEPPTSAVASAAIALASREDAADVVATLVEYSVADSADFATTWRLLQAASRAGPSPAIDAWLRTGLRDSEAWMLRGAAVDAIAARGRPGDARPALDDSYPRVRAKAAGVLADDSVTMTRRATLARRDPWPLVRAAAITSLGGEPTAIPVVVAAVDDPMSEVRAAAILVLAGMPHDEGWDRVNGRLRNRKEWPEVTSAAIDYVVAHCRTDAVEGLVVVIARAGSPNPRIDDIDNAARAIEALRVLGTPDSDAAVRHLRTLAEVPPILKTALETPISEARRCAPVAP